MFQKHESLNKLLSHIPQRVTQASADYPLQTDVARILYESWFDRGCPEGAPEIDWLKAEDEFRKSPQAASK
jgi:hypothetical protein